MDDNNNKRLEDMTFSRGIRMVIKYGSYDVWPDGHRITAYDLGKGDTSHWIIAYYHKRTLRFMEAPNRSRKVLES